MKRQRLLFTAPRQIVIEEENLPPLKADQLLVQSEASAISAGSEMLIYRGEMPAGIATDETISALAGRLEYPLPYGYAVVGRVVEQGGAVKEDWRGRLVFAFQPHASHFIAAVEELLPLPAGMDPKTALFFPNMETAVSLVMDGRPVIGEQAAVFGQGVVGLLATALLARLPLASLVTVDAYRLRRQWSRHFGADAALDPNGPDMAAQLLHRLQGQRPYRGADLVYELSGNPQALSAALEAAGYHGRVIVGSWYGQKEARLNLGGRFHRDHIRIVSSQVSHLAPIWLGRWNKARRQGVAWEMLAQIEPASLITHQFPFSSAGQAYQQLDRQSEQVVQAIMLHNS